MIKNYGAKLLQGISNGLFVLIIIATAVSVISMIPVFWALDWSNIQTFVESLRVILFWVIGIEFARLLIEYRTKIIIELLIFVIARKMLLIDDDMYAVGLGAVVIALLLVVWQWLQRLKTEEVGKGNTEG